jgi:hypothetical protein
VNKTELLSKLYDEMEVLWSLYADSQRKENKVNKNKKIKFLGNVQEAENNLVKTIMTLNLNLPDGQLEEFVPSNVQLISMKA